MLISGHNFLVGFIVSGFVCARGSTRLYSGVFLGRGAFKREEEISLSGYEPRLYPGPRLRPYGPVLPCEPRRRVGNKG